MKSATGQKFCAFNYCVFNKTILNDLFFATLSRELNNEQYEILNVPLLSCLLDHQSGGQWF